MAKLCYRHNQIIIRLKGQGKGNKLRAHTIQWHLTSLGPFYIIFSQVLCVYTYVCVHAGTCTWVQRPEINFACCSSGTLHTLQLAF